MSCQIILKHEHGGRGTGNPRAVLWFQLAPAQRLPRFLLQSFLLVPAEAQKQPRATWGKHKGSLAGESLAHQDWAKFIEDGQWILRVQLVPKPRARTQAPAGLVGLCPKCCSSSLCSEPTACPTLCSFTLPPKQGMLVASATCHRVLHLEKDGWDHRSAPDKAGLMPFAPALPCHCWRWVLWDCWGW